MSYALCQHPGCCSDHGKVISLHPNLDAAKRAVVAHSYTSPDGRYHQPYAIVVNDGTLHPGDLLSMGAAMGRRAEWVQL